MHCNEANVNYCDPCPAVLITGKLSASPEEPKSTTFFSFVNLISLIFP